MRNGSTGRTASEAFSCLTAQRKARRKNFDFEKKAHYFTTVSSSAVFAMTTQVLGYENWTPEVVKDRQAELTQRLYDEWELN
jgi:hypothetical protein